MTKPLPEEPVPATLDWDLWVGPAPMRPYNHGYVPHDWRGWWDFGCGALGDMGCHIMDGPFWSLDLSEPESVECIRLEGKNDQTGPTKCITKYEFPARHNKFANKQMSPVDVYWYEGGLQPERPEGIPEGERLGDGDNNGSLFIGETGMLTTGCYASGTRLVPKARMESYERPPETIPRVPNNGDHRLDWYTACIENGRAGSDFEYAVPLTETVLLGNLAQRTGEKIYWNSKKMRVTNNVPDAERYIKRKYRRGWRL